MAGRGVVVFDIDGGLADMSPVTGRLGPRPWRRNAWQEFFDGIGDAIAIEAGRELVAAVAALGFSAIYSMTRPEFTTAATRRWLSDHDFPPGAVLSRPNDQQARSALEIKLQHCQIIERRLRRGYLAAFVDDEPDIVTGLRTHGYAGRRFERLHECNLVNLRAALAIGPAQRGFTPATTRTPVTTERKHLRLARMTYRPPLRRRRTLSTELAAAPT
jgi:hypothetical protein